jgi:hypothetical protein
MEQIARALLKWIVLNGRGSEYPLSAKLIDEQRAALPEE